MDLLEFVQNKGTPKGNRNFEKIAEAVIEKEAALQKQANEIRAGGRFIGRGFSTTLFQKVAQDLKSTGVASENPITAAQTPSLPSIELPTNAPGPNDTLRTVRPNGGEQFNNDLFMKELEKSRKEQGLGDIANNGISVLSGSNFGTEAQFGINHNK